MKLQSLERDGGTFLALGIVFSHGSLCGNGLQSSLTWTAVVLHPYNTSHVWLISLDDGVKLVRAMDIVRAIPFQPDRAVCLSDLDTCRMWGHVERGGLGSMRSRVR